MLNTIFYNFTSTSCSVWGLLYNYHKAKQSSEYSRYAPCWVPCFWMVITYRQTQTSVCLEPAIRSDHVNAGWLKWKIFWEN